jgi:hypothetical protein
MPSASPASICSSVRLSSSANSSTRFMVLQPTGTLHCRLVPQRSFSKQTVRHPHSFQHQAATGVTCSALPRLGCPGAVNDGRFEFGHALALQQMKLGTQKRFSSSFVMSRIAPLARMVSAFLRMLGSILFVGAIIDLMIGHKNESKGGKTPRKKKSSVYVMPGFRRPWR